MITIIHTQLKLNQISTNTALDIDFCPVKVVWEYWKIRKHTNMNTALFSFMDGSSITRQFFSDQLKLFLTWANLDNHKYKSHSFRIGAASTAAMLGTEDNLWGGGIIMLLRNM